MNLRILITATLLIFATTFPTRAAEAPSPTEFFSKPNDQLEAYITLSNGNTYENAKVQRVSHPWVLIVYKAKARDALRSTWIQVNQVASALIYQTPATKRTADKKTKAETNGG